ncbi:hypothetical protein [Ornithinimicrobium sufpigmenti]|uniref:hypothetical protein n=1 Tax=Ornithinimicrobium sufpigmenti TaxID=2508882 RepID=UPI001035830A|nr:MULTISPECIES: hypothetical protein [unclassified Ornithinimicrobium]
MRLYATSPLRRTLQITADLGVLAWVLVWVAIGRWVHALVMTLAAPADPLRSAGTSVSDRMTDIAGQVVRIPLVGEELDGPFTGAAGAGGDLVRAGDALEGAVRTVAWLVALLSAGTPILLVVAVWALLRWIWVRRAASLGAEVDDPESQQLLALRALVRQHPRRLQQLYPDPVAAYRSGDPQVWRALADLELAEHGLRSRSPRQAQRARPPSTP